MLSRAAEAKHGEEGTEEEYHGIYSGLANELSTADIRYNVTHTQTSLCEHASIILVCGIV
jgi:hypothetical protein